MITTALVRHRLLQLFLHALHDPLFLFPASSSCRITAKVVAGSPGSRPLYHLVNICRAFAAGHVDHVFGSIMWIVVVAAALAPVPFRLMRRRCNSITGNIFHYGGTEVAEECNGNGF